MVGYTDIPPVRKDTSWLSTIAQSHIAIKGKAPLRFKFLNSHRNESVVISHSLDYLKILKHIFFII